MKLIPKSLPGKSKGGLADDSTGSRPLSNVDINTLSSGASPLTDPSGTMSSRKENLSPSPPRKFKKQRLNSQQAQDKREYDLDIKRRFIKAHKAATVLYDQEREKSPTAGCL